MARHARHRALEHDTYPALTPLTAPLRDAIAAVQVRGRGRILSELRVREASGDETVTQFRDVNPARTFSERERDELFRLPAP